MFKLGEGSAAQAVVGHIFWAFRWPSNHSREERSQLRASYRQNFVLCSILLLIFHPNRPYTFIPRCTDKNFLQTRLFRLASRLPKDNDYIQQCEIMKSQQHQVYGHKGEF